MADPATGTVAATAIAVGAITITGSILGLEYQLLLVGMFGGLIAVSFFPQSTRWRMATSVITSALLAGYATPVLAVVATAQVPMLDRVADEPLRLLLALVVGVSAQTLIPLTLGWIQRFGGKAP